MTLPVRQWSRIMGSAKATLNVPRDRETLDALRSALSLEWVVRNAGLSLTPEGDRLVGPCHFHDGSSSSFGLYTLAGDDVPLSRVGCWSGDCGFPGGDVFTFIRARYALATFPAAVQMATTLLEEFQRTGGAWTPTAVTAPIRADPADLEASAALALESAATSSQALVRLIEHKKKKAPDSGWRLVTPEALVERWAVGVEDEWTTLVPHYDADGVCRAVKTRVAGGHLYARRGSDLSYLYGSWLDAGHQRVLLVEGESDAWVASEVLRGLDVDVLALPAGAGGKARPRQAWLEQLRGRDVLVCFDADPTGRAATARWCEALVEVARRVGRADLDEGRDVGTTVIGDLPLKWAEDEADTPAVAASGGLPLRRLTLEDLSAMPEPEWLLEGLLPATGTAQVYGPSNLGKTFVVIDLVLSIASGQTRWHDYVVKRPRASVAYVAIEDEGDWPHRVAAWTDAHPGADISGLVTYFPDGQIDLSAPEAAEVWIDKFKGENLALIVVDTQAQASGGAEENSNSEMGRMMNNVRQIATRLGCLVVLVHHTGTVGTRARGASSQIGALDVVISVLPPRGRGDNASSTAATEFVEQPVTGVIQVVKNRRARKRPPSAFKLEPSGSSVWARPIAREESASIAVTAETEQRWQIIRALVRMGGSADSVRKIRTDIRDHNEEFVVSERKFGTTLEHLVTDDTITKLEGQGATGAARYEINDLSGYALAIDRWKAQSANVVPIFGGAEDA